MSFRKGPSGHLRRDPSEEAKIIKVNTSKRRSGQDECLFYGLTERRGCHHHQLLLQDHLFLPPASDQPGKLIKCMQICLKPTDAIYFVL